MYSDIIKDATSFRIKYNISKAKVANTMGSSFYLVKRFERMQNTNDCNFLLQYLEAMNTIVRNRCK